MASNILSIGQSALAAAQVGLSTAGHNIANSATPGFSRQVVVQGASLPQNFGFGFLGQGTEISTVKRIYSDFLGLQVQSAQTTKSGLDSYYAQIKQIDNLLADPVAGLSPALQNFFSGIQELSSNPASIPARQAALSSGESLASRFQSLAGRLKEIDQGINSQITSSVNVINTYAQQIATLNDTIGRLQRGSGQPANDLLDQRDQLILDLNKEIKATVVKQDNGDYNVFIGNGQPLVVGVKTFSLTTVSSPTNPSKVEVAYQTSGGPVIVGASSLVGGKLGGLVAFRSQTLEPTQASLDSLATGLADTFNAQHRLGQDIDGNLGGNFFSATGASDFSVGITDPRLIAAAAPIRTVSGSANTGTGSISAGSVDAAYLATPLSTPLTLTYSAGSNKLSGFPATQAVTVTSGGVSTVFAAGTPVTYTSGATVSFGGISFTLSGTPADTDTYTVASNAGGVGDNRNALLLGALQTSNIMNGGSTTYQGAYSQIVSQIGNKTREIDVTSSAAGKMLSETSLAIQNESGVNLDEEATNLLRYQQAYQAAGKVMQIASEMFDVLLSLGR
ncbi:MAG: flagellar hook-associated protein FlgK [Sulfuriferula multivorans]|uniref:Flagellar hook-associated protein 1 n=1 Tax=Sulfuriferula multivorans TaxID=1559896 RepID=A0A7C9P2E3_9PROT|nr:flagellar hook-associated protein FlgK [Sulfuriferula multivorans]